MQLKIKVPKVEGDPAVLFDYAQGVWIFTTFLGDDAKEGLNIQVLIAGSSVGVFPIQLHEGVEGEDEEFAESFLSIEVAVPIEISKERSYKEGDSVVLKVGEQTLFTGKLPAFVKETPIKY